MERPSLAAKRDFDLLPRSAEIVVQPALRSDLGALSDMANRLVPGIQTTEPDLEKYHDFDPGSILTFKRKGILLGAVAFLYLNDRGHDALILDEMSLTQPELGLLAGLSEPVSAIYVRAIAGQGRAMAGLGNVSAYLSRPRLAPADLYAQPSSIDGRNLNIAIGFHPFPSYQRDLWRYQRPWNRFPLNASTAQPARSFADARH
ncbi:MAG: hypothetical protein Q7J60_22290 [Bradyrhizobium sp.]|nr:hypothetical protein [Bradyrhizobium sp.]